MMLQHGKDRAAKVIMILGHYKWVLVAAGVVALVAASVVTWRCRFLSPGPVFDKLEVALIIGFFQPPCCVIPGGSVPPFIEPKEHLPVWVRAVNAVQVRRPIGGLEVQIDVAENTGKPLGAGKVVELSQKRLVTSEEGFGTEPVTFTAETPGVYRIRATYRDRDVTSTSYSQPIIVQSGALPKAQRLTYGRPRFGQRIWHALCCVSTCW